MSDLVEFIEARLTEDELWAKAASAPSSPDYGPAPLAGAHWVWGLGDNWEHYQPDPLEEYLGEHLEDDRPNLVTVEEWPLMWGGTLAHRVLYCDTAVRTADAAHIARHDPARVLREVEAKRRILTEVVEQIDGMDAQIASEWGCASDPPQPPEHLPLLRLLALPYSDHPDYRSEWSPAS